jgi:hypothetical protein
MTSVQSSPTSDNNPSSNEIPSLEKSPKDIPNYTFPNSIREIPSDFFRQCSKLTSIVIPPLVKNIPNHCFQECSSL